MKWKRWVSGLALSAALLALPAQAMDYNFSTAAPQDFYKSGSYEDVYGSQYNYGGKNVVDYQIPELEYGLFSTTQTGVMERTTLPGLQAAVATSDGTGSGGFGVSGGGPITVLTEAGASAGGVSTLHLGQPARRFAEYVSENGLHQHRGNEAERRQHRNGENPLPGYQHESVGGRNQREHEEGAGALQLHLGLGRQRWSVWA